MLTYETAMEFFRYEPSSGKLFWKKALSSRVNVGDEAGTISSTDGYRQIQFNRKLYRAHRIVMLMHTKGFDTSLQIDHMNHERDDNRIENLRLVTNSINGKNTKMHKNNTTGVTGVTFDKNRNKYKAQIVVSHKLDNLGRFNTFEEAVQARLQAEIKYGFHPNHGK